MVIPRFRWIGCALLAVLLAAAGCGSPQENAASSPTPSTGSTAGGRASSPAATPTATPTSTTPDSTPTTRTPAGTPSPPPLKAADGKDYQACADGTCEVLLSGPVRIGLADGTIRVTKVKAGGVEFELDLASGAAKTIEVPQDTCGGLIIYLGGAVSPIPCQDDGTDPTLEPVTGAVSLQVKGISDRGAVLHVVSG